MIWRLASGLDKFTIQYLYCLVRYMCAKPIGVTLNLLDSMNFRPTSTLGSIIARAAFKAERNDNANHLIDRLLLLALDEPHSHATRLVQMLAGEHNVVQLRSQIEEELYDEEPIDRAERASTRSAFFRKFTIALPRLRLWVSRVIRDIFCCLWQPIRRRLRAGFCVAITSTTTACSMRWECSRSMKIATSICDYGKCNSQFTIHKHL